MKPFLLGKKTLELAPLRPAQTHVHAVHPVAGTVRPASAAGGPNVEVVKEGDKVVRLIVTCSCGERTEIECLYNAGT